MKLWKEVRGHQVGAALSPWEYLGEGSCNVQKRKFSPVIWDLFILSYKHLYKLFLKPTTITCLLYFS